MGYHDLGLSLDSCSVFDSRSEQESKSEPESKAEPESSPKCLNLDSTHYGYSRESNVKNISNF